MIKINYVSGTKFVGVRMDSDSFEEFRSKYITVTNNISTLMHHLLKDGRLNMVTLGKNSKTVIGYHKMMLDGEEITDSAFVDWIENNYPDVYGPVSDIEKLKSLKRSWFHYVAERYKSYFTRNKKKKKKTKIPLPTIKNDKSINFKESVILVDSDNKTLSFPKLGLSVKYHCAVQDKDVAVNGEKFGGNFSIKQGTFVIKQNVSKQPAYKPSGWLGFDLNMQADHWIYMSDGTVISRPSEISILIQEIKELNSLIGDRRKKVSERTLRSSERKKIRQKRDGLHKELDKLILPIAHELIDKAKDSNLGLAIDGVGTGQSNGTFGQDHLIPMLRKECIRQGIPHYIVHTPYTTKRCMKCKIAHDKNKANDNDFICKMCEHKCVTHENAANNISEKAAWYQSKNFPYGDYRGRLEGNMLRNKKRDGWKEEDDKDSWCVVLKD